jgi:hypothetical protein
MKVKYNVKGVESRSDFEPIPKGVYEFEVETCEVTKPKGKDQRIEVVYVIPSGDLKGRKLYDYINLESEAAAWKLRQFLETFGLVTDKKETGEFDPAKLVGEKLMVKVVHKPDNREGHEGEIQSRVGSTFAAGESEEGEEDLDGSSDEDEDDEGEGEGEIDLDELDRAELKKLIKEQELDIKVTKGMSDDDVRKAIAEALGEGGDDEGYDDLSVEELKTTCKERGLSEKGSKKILIARLEKDDEAAKKDGDPF